MVSMNSVFFQHHNVLLPQSCWNVDDTLHSPATEQHQRQQHIVDRNGILVSIPAHTRTVAAVLLIVVRDSPESMWEVRPQVRLKPFSTKVLTCCLT